VKGGREACFGGSTAVEYKKRHNGKRYGASFCFCPDLLDLAADLTVGICIGMDVYVGGVSLDQVQMVSAKTGGDRPPLSDCTSFGCGPSESVS